jgi:hypothetical protein
MANGKRRVYNDTTYRGGSAPKRMIYVPEWRYGVAIVWVETEWSPDLEHVVFISPDSDEPAIEAYVENIRSLPSGIREDIEKGVEYPLPPPNVAVESLKTYTLIFGSIIGIFILGILCFLVMLFLF